MIAGRRLFLALCALLLCASCESGGTPPPAGDPEETASGAPSDATPQSGGTVTFGVYGEPATLDPHSPLASDLTFALARPVYRSLYRFDPSGEPVPDLVAGLKTSGDLATVRLAPARWSDGRPITAQDVKASIEMAGPPSGFAEIDFARVKGRSRLALSGDVVDWEQTLARATFVLPRDGRKVYSGPFVLGARVPGLQVTLRPNSESEITPYLDRVVVQFTEGLEISIALLQREQLDAAALPSSVNLSQRLEALSLAHDAELGWERIVLDLTGSALTAQQRKAVAIALDRREMETGFVRDHGRIADTLVPEPGAGGGEGPYEPIFRGSSRDSDSSLDLASPSGDELIELIQRLVQVQLDSSGFDVELLNVDHRRFYGEWAEAPPVDGLIRRAAGAPGLPANDTPKSLDALPLFHVETFVAWNEDVQGIEVNPTLEGPLWDAHLWHLAE